MDLEDIEEAINLYIRNVQKLQSNIVAYNHEINSVRQSLLERWPHIGRGDGRIISVHNFLLSSVNEVNQQVIKLNLHIKLNRISKKNICNDELKSLEHNYKVNHTNLDGIEVGEVDSSRELIQSDIRPAPERIMSANEYASADGFAVPVLPMPLRQSELLPPKGGKHMSSNEIYDKIVKNISVFIKDSVLDAAMTHINICEKCIFVTELGKNSLQLEKLLSGQLPVKEIKQLPDFGEVFAVYDNEDQIIPRVLINAPTEGGGYDAYLLDYGEHIHLDAGDTIFQLPRDVAAIPAEAIRCYVRNYDIKYMRKFLYDIIRIRILSNNGNDLEVELLEKENLQLDLHAKQEVSKGNLVKSNAQVQKDCEQPAITDPKIAQSTIPSTQPVEQVPTATSDPELVEPTVKLSEADRVMLEDVEHGTSNAVKAVLGFNPTDDKRICRHYDPKIGGCFKGSNCRLLHQPFAPHGATKDTELVEALPEASNVSMAPKELGCIVRIQVTFISSPTQIYVHFVDESSPLVWSEKDVLETERKLNRDPVPMDMVLALYDDGYYYRAQILEEMDGLFKIFYVDYGNTEFATIKKLAQCNNARSLKPHRAISCFIEGVKHNSTPSQVQSSECMQFLKNTILNAEFNVLLVSQMPDGYVIRFLDAYAEISKQIIRRGYGEPSMDN